MSHLGQVISYLWSSTFSHDVRIKRENIGDSVESFIFRLELGLSLQQDVETSYEELVLVIAELGSLNKSSYWRIWEFSLLLIFLFPLFLTSWMFVSFMDPWGASW